MRRIIEEKDLLFTLVDSTLRITDFQDDHSPPLASHWLRQSRLPCYNRVWKRRNYWPLFIDFDRKFVQEKSFYSLKHRKGTTHEKSSTELLATIPSFCLEKQLCDIYLVNYTYSISQPVGWPWVWHWGGLQFWLLFSPLRLVSAVSSILLILQSCKEVNLLVTFVLNCIVMS